jgi:IS1 family transposase
MSWAAATDRTSDTIQPVIDRVPHAFQYCTDGHAAYAAVNWHRGLHLVAPGQSQTYAVEANNAELQHCLARLTRRTRCYSKRLAWLTLVVKLFVHDVHYWNQRQLWRRAHPRYSQSRSLVSFVTFRV